MNLFEIGEENFKNCLNELRYEQVHFESLLQCQYIQKYIYNPVQLLKNKL